MGGERGNRVDVVRARAFASYSTDLVPGQDKVQPFFDVFLYDRITGNNTLVSHVPGSATTTGDRESSFPIISADGAYVVFTSQATNLVGGQSDPNDNPSLSVWLEDVLLYDRITGGAHAGIAHGGQPEHHCQRRLLRRIHQRRWALRGRFLCRHEPVPGQNDANGQDDVFLYARLMGGMTLVSHVPGSATATANDGSANGRIGVRNGFVTFESRATNLVGGQTDANGGSDVFLYNDFNAEVRLVSHAVGAPTTTAGGTSGAPVIDADGSSVAFESTATNLVTGQEDFNNAKDVFVFDRLSGTSAWCRPTLSSRPPARPTEVATARRLVAAANSWSFSRTPPICLRVRLATRAPRTSTCSTAPLPRTHAWG